MSLPTSTTHDTNLSKLPPINPPLPSVVNSNANGKSRNNRTQSAEFHSKPRTLPKAPAASSPPPNGPSLDIAFRESIAFLEQAEKLTKEDKRAEEIVKSSFDLSFLSPAEQEELAALGITGGPPPSKPAPSKGTKETVSYGLFCSIINQLAKERVKFAETVREQAHVFAEREASLREEIVLSNARAESLNTRLRLFDNKLSTAFTEVEELSKKKRYLKGELEEERQLYESLLKQRIETEAQLDEARAEIQTLTTLNKAFEERLEQANHAIESLTRSKTVLELTTTSEKQMFEKRLQNLIKANQEKKEALERAQADNRLQAKTIQTLEYQLALARDQVNNLSDIISKRNEAKAKAEAEARLKRRTAVIEPPTGHLALVFTDIQGSTAQWEMHPEVMTIALDIHNKILRDMLVRTGGYEVKTEGDAFMLAFPSALKAVWFCLFVQEALLQADWPEQLFKSPHAAIELSADGRTLFKGLRVRMGVHVGDPQCSRDPVTKRMDYFGQMVNRTARISAVGAGGQILLSGQCYEEVKAELSGVTAVRLGTYRLKGVAQEEDLVQVLPNTLAERAFPPLRCDYVGKHFGDHLQSMPPSSGGASSGVDIPKADAGVAPYTTTTASAGVSGDATPNAGGGSGGEGPAPAVLSELGEDSIAQLYDDMDVIMREQAELKQQLQAAHAAKQELGSRLLHLEQQVVLVLRSEADKNKLIEQMEAIDAKNDELEMELDITRKKLAAAEQQMASERVEKIALLHQLQNMVVKSADEEAADAAAKSAWLVDQLKHAKQDAAASKEAEEASGQQHHQQHQDDAVDLLAKRASQLEQQLAQEAIEKQMLAKKVQEFKRKHAEKVGALVARQKDIEKELAVARRQVEAYARKIDSLKSKSKLRIEGLLHKQRLLGDRAALQAAAEDAASSLFSPLSDSASLWGTPRSERSSASSSREDPSSALKRRPSSPSLSQLDLLAVMPPHPQSSGRKRSSSVDHPPPLAAAGRTLSSSSVLDAASVAAASLVAAPATLVRHNSSPLATVDSLQGALLDEPTLSLDLSSPLATARAPKPPTAEVAVQTSPRNSNTPEALPQPSSSLMTAIPAAGSLILDRESLSARRREPRQLAIDVVSSTPSLLAHPSAEPSLTEPHHRPSTAPVGEHGAPFSVPTIVVHDSSAAVAASASETPVAATAAHTRKGTVPLVRHSVPSAAYLQSDASAQDSSTGSQLEQDHRGLEVIRYELFEEPVKNANGEPAGTQEFAVLPIGDFLRFVNLIASSYSQPKPHPPTDAESAPTGIGSNEMKSVDALPFDARGYAIGPKSHHSTALYMSSSSLPADGELLSREVSKKQAFLVSKGVPKTVDATQYAMLHRHGHQFLYPLVHPRYVQRPAQPYHRPDFVLTGTAAPTTLKSPRSRSPPKPVWHSIATQATTVTQKAVVGPQPLEPEKSATS